MGAASGRTAGLSLDLAFAKLSRFAQFDPELLDRIRGSLIRSEVYSAEAAVGDGAGALRIIVRGWAARARVLPDGRRQIFSFLIPGDVVSGRRRSSLWMADGVTALTRVETVELGVLCAAAAGRAEWIGALTHAFHATAATEDELLFDHIVRLGQQSAIERTANLFIELWQRLAAAGLARGQSYELPLKQEHLADALGMTLVHVNRTLQRLRNDGLLEFRGGKVTILEPRRLASLGKYSGDWIEEGPVAASSGRSALPFNAPA